MEKIKLTSRVLEILEHMPNEELGIFMKALIKWNNDEEISFDNQYCSIAWTVIRPILEKQKDISNKRKESIEKALENLKQEENEQ